MDNGLDIDIQKRRDAAVVTFGASSISDVEAIADASSRVKQYVDAERPRRIVFDFTGVRFLSSQVLGLLLEVRAHAKDRGGDVAISAINPQLHRVFRITNLDTIFCFFPDADSAIDTTAV